jgi:PAS domain S-box-containing protein
MFSFVRNITERYRAEESLRQSFEEIEDLYNDAASGYHSLDKNGVICRINDTELRWLGYTQEEVVGKMKYADLLSAKDAQAFRKNYQKLQEEGFIRDIECEIIRKDGSVLFGLINATAIYDSSGNYVMSRSTLVDITERKRAELETRMLSKHIQTAREEEKASLARDIHDELGSTLAALKMDASWLADKLKAEKNLLPLQERIKAITDLLETATKSTRRIITDLRPAILDDFGLLAAIKWQADQFHKRTGIECRVTCNANEGYNCDDELDKSLSINLFRIFQESLANVARHSGASRVEAEFLLNNNEVVLTIRDNGRGLPEGHRIASTSYGIRGMRERTMHLGGEFKIDSPPDGGLRVTVKLPIPVTSNPEQN